MNNPLRISVVFSVYNEDESLPLLFSELELLMKASPHGFEWIFVNDGSVDNSLSKMRDFCKNFNFEGSVARYIQFSRNFGHEAAMIAGIDHATGDAVICMDADLQHPISLIPQMVETFQKGFEIINMVRSKNEGVSLLNGLLSATFYRFINRISKQQLAVNASDFFLVSRKVAKILKDNYRERNRFLRGFIQNVGFRATTMEFVAPARVAGQSKYSFFRLFTLTSQAVTSFSRAPLFLGIWFGFFFAIISLVLGVYTLWTFLFGEAPPSGYTTIVLFMSLSFMILFFLIGIIGIYVGYLFEEQKKRPIYLVDEMNFPE